MNKKFDTLIVITPNDFMRLQHNYRQLIDCLPSDNLFFVGPSDVEPLLKNLNLGDNAKYINENDILPFDKVHNCIIKHMSDYLAGREWARKATGWYYQQFIKMAYSLQCDNDFYMTWDGDTIPCKKFSMFKEGSDIPYLDLKEEFHQEYFDTMGIILPGYKKCIGPSFISEHMLFNCEIMRNLINKIESNSNLEGLTFYEKIINAIPPEKMTSACFSEFETYGTHCCFNYPTVYKLREWHSFRLGGQFFDPDKMTQQDYEWLGNDFHAISFEKGQSVREDHKNLFDNPDYQKKLSAKQMLLIAQEEFQDGYVEKWDTVPNSDEPTYSEFNDIKKSLINDIDFLGDLTDSLLKVCSIWGPKDRIHVDNDTCLCNTLFNTSSGHIYIGSYTFCGHNVSIITGTHNTSSFQEDRMDFKTEGNDIHIGKGVWLCTNCVILGPCTIDDNAVVAAGSIVLPNTHIKANELWAGSPAVFKKIISE